MDYDDIKKKLRIDLLRLDQELTELPFLVQEAAEISIELFNDVQKADLELDVAKAQVASDLREEKDESGKVPSETKIVSMIILDPRVQEAQTKLNELRYQSRLANELVTNLRDKSRLLGKTSDLVIAGFITPNSRKAFEEENKERVAQRRRPS